MHRNPPIAPVHPAHPTYVRISSARGPLLQVARGCFYAQILRQKAAVINHSLSCFLSTPCSELRSHHHVRLSEGHEDPVKLEPGGKPRQASLSITTFGFCGRERRFSDGRSEHRYFQMPVCRLPRRGGRSSVFTRFTWRLPPLGVIPAPARCAVFAAHCPRLAIFSAQELVVTRVSDGHCISDLMPYSGNEVERAAHDQTGDRPDPVSWSQFVVQPASAKGTPRRPFTICGNPENLPKCPESPKGAGCFPRYKPRCVDSDHRPPTFALRHQRLLRCQGGGSPFLDDIKARIWSLRQLRPGRYLLLQEWSVVFSPAN